MMGELLSVGDSPSSFEARLESYTLVHLILHTNAFQTSPQPTSPPPSITPPQTLVTMSVHLRAVLNLPKPSSTLEDVTRAILGVQERSWWLRPIPGNQGIIRNDPLCLLLGSSQVHVLWAINVLFQRGHLWL